MSSNQDLIEAVKKYALLYDKSHEDFVDKPKKVKTWKEIGKELGRSAEACEKNFKNLRDKYVRELKIIRLSKGKTNSEPKWPYMDAMDFLMPHTTHQGTNKSISRPIPRRSAEPSKKMSNKKRPPPVTKFVPAKKATPVISLKKVSVSPKQTVNSQSPYKNSKADWGRDDDIIHDEADSYHEDDEMINGGTVVNNEERSKSQPPSSRVSTNDNVMSEVPKRIRTIVDTLEELLLNSVETSKTQQDESYHFGMNVACRLRKMTRKNAAIAQAEIQYRLRQIEIENGV